MLYGVKRGFFSKETSMGRAPAATAIVARFCDPSVGVFIDTDLPKPREVFRHPPSGSLNSKARYDPAWSPQAPLGVKKANIVFAIDADRKIWCMNA
jgi:hypothetical protein